MVCIGATSHLLLSYFTTQNLWISLGSAVMVLLWQNICTMGVLNEHVVMTVVIHIGTDYSNTTFLLLLSNATCFDRKRSSGVLPHNLKNEGQMFLFGRFLKYYK
jgi:hypothetical protein